MIIFRYLRKIREFEKRHFPFVETLVDFDLIHEIGFHQYAKSPIILTTLFAQNIGPPATVQRRLDRLKRRGIVVQRQSKSDGRRTELRLSPSILRLYRRYARMLSAGM